MGVGTIVSSEGPLVDFHKIFLGLAKSYEICFSYTKLRKQPFLLKFLKSRGARPLFPSLLTPMLPPRDYSSQSHPQCVPYVQPAS